MHENCPASELLSYCCDSKTQWTNFSKMIMVDMLRHKF